MIRILLVKQTESQLCPGELSALHRVFNDAKIEFKTTDPKSIQQHAGDCKRIRPTVVLLPFTFEPWLPVQAMTEGFRHIVVSAGEVLEVCPIRLDFKPDFKPFVP